MREIAPEAAPAPAGPVLFDALLTPHRSLSPRGFVVLMTVICGVSFVAGLAFFMLGAWPIPGFLGLDVLLIYLAFKVNYRRGRMYETLRLTHDDLTVERVDPRGRRRAWRFQPIWLQVLIDEPPHSDSPLVLRSHGRSLAVGSFLAPQERADLARALRDALTRARQPAHAAEAEA